MDIIGSKGYTRLHVETLCRRKNVVRDILTANSADVNAATNDGHTPLHLAAADNDVFCIETILEFKPKVNMQDSDGNTPLHLALENDCTEAVDLITKYPEVDVSIRNFNGISALHLATLKGNVFAAERIVRVDRSLVDIRTNEGSSALHLAAYYGRMDVAKVLVRAGDACLELINNSKKTPLMVAKDRRHIEMADYLLAEGASTETLVGDDNNCDPDGGLNYFSIVDGPTISSVASKNQFSSPSAGTKINPHSPVNQLVRDDSIDAIHQDVTQTARFVVSSCSGSSSTATPESSTSVRAHPEARLERAFLTEKPTKIISRYFKKHGLAFEKVVNLCERCGEHVLSVVFLCGHGACEKCASFLTECHVCNTSITYKLHLSNKN